MSLVLRLWLVNFEGHFASTSEATNVSPSSVPQGHDVRLVDESVRAPGDRS